MRRSEIPEPLARAKRTAVEQLLTVARAPPRHPGWVPPNQMAIEQSAVAGKGSQTNPERWGDYASMSVDPTDDCTFWFSTQFVSQTGKFNWSTSIVPVKFSSCQ